jgi:hypothetical protein
MATLEFQRSRRVRSPTKWQQAQGRASKLDQPGQQAEIQGHRRRCRPRRRLRRLPRSAELGYEVNNFVFHDTPRRAHSIAAQGGINAAKNYQNDGD